MLRSISRDVLPHHKFVVTSTSRNLYTGTRPHTAALLACRRQQWHRTSILSSTSLSRYYSPLNSSPDPKLTGTAPPHIPLPQASRKHKVELRPGPLKSKQPTSPSQASSHPIPNAPVRVQEGSHLTPALSLNKAKEEAQKDISEAEKHGIFKPPPPNANWFRATLHKAIELAKFYYRGVKLVFSRRREIAAIRARIKAGGAPLTRQEFRLIRTQKDDVNKVVPFLIIALLLEEVIPLIAIYAPFMLPSTCILPSQRARIEAKRAEKALNSSINSKAIFSSIKSQAPAASISLDALKQVSGAPTSVCSLLGLSTLGIDALRIRRIRKHLEFIAEDDKLLIQDQSIKSLSDADLTDALAERGLLLSNTTNASKEKEKLLQHWLDAVNKAQSEDALATRLTLILGRQ